MWLIGSRPRAVRTSSTICGNGASVTHMGASPSVVDKSSSVSPALAICIVMSSPRSSATARQTSRNSLAHTTTLSLPEPSAAAVELPSPSIARGRARPTRRGSARLRRAPRSTAGVMRCAFPRPPGAGPRASPPGRRLPRGRCRCQRCRRVTSAARATSPSSWAWLLRSVAAVCSDCCLSRSAESSCSLIEATAATLSGDGVGGRTLLGGGQLDLKRRRVEPAHHVVDVVAGLGDSVRLGETRVRVGR